MERVTSLKTASEKFSGLGLCCGAVHGCPLRRQLSTAFETPVRIFFGNVFAPPGAPDVLEQAAADDLADFGLVICDEVLGHAADDLRDPVLPLHVPIGHFDLTAGQADDRRALCSACGSHCQVLDKGIKLFSHTAMAVQEVEHLVEKYEHRPARRLKNTCEGFGSRWGGLGRRPKFFTAIVS